MNDHETAPIDIPVRYTYRGRWTCLICDKTGPGGADGYHRHYADWHWDYRRDHT